jgi:hypothetical protein
MERPEAERVVDLRLVEVDLNVVELLSRAQVQPAGPEADGVLDHAHVRERRARRRATCS